MKRFAVSRVLLGGVFLFTAACATPTTIPMQTARTATRAAATLTPDLPYALGAVITDREPDIGPTTATRARVPVAADLRPNCSPVANQASFGSCTAFAIIKGFREYLSRKEGNNTDLSARFFWYAERQYVDEVMGGDSVNANAGVPTELGMVAIGKYGTTAEAVFPYPSLAEFAAIKQLPKPEQGPALDKLAAVPPPAESWDKAKAYRVTQPIKPCGDVAGMKSAFAAGKPVVLAFRLYESFATKDVAATGNVPVPDLTKEKALGGHAMCGVGYDDQKKVIIVRNSWSEKWGDKGYCYVPYAYFQVKDAMGRGLVKGGWTIQ